MVRLPLGANKPWASWILLTINVLIYIVSLILSVVLLSSVGLPVQNVFSPNGLVLHMMGWKENALIFQGQYWRFLTAMFLHGGVMHIFFNGFALHALGSEAERIYGHGRFLAIYFISGLAGGIASYAFSSSPSVGASGAIFGLIGALAIFFYTSRQILGEIGKQQLQNMIAIVVVNIIIGLSASGIIDNYAHMGGLAGGVLVGWLLVPRYEVNPYRIPPSIDRVVRASSWLIVLGVVIVLGALVVVIQPPL